MKKKGCLLLACLLLSVLLGATYAAPTYADTISDLKKKQEDLKKKETELKNQSSKTQSAMNQANQEAGELQDTLLDLEESMDELGTSIMEIMAEIELLQNDILQKKADIEQAKADLEEAIRVKEAQYESMCIRIQMIYEVGNQNYLQLLLTSGSVPEFLNKADYMEELYSYDRNMLSEYEKCVERVTALECRLEEELIVLEQNEEMLRESQAELDLELSELQKKSDHYAMELAEVKVRASRYANELKKQQTDLRGIQKDLQSNQKMIDKEIEKQKKAAQEEQKKENIPNPPPTSGNGGAPEPQDNTWGNSSSDLGQRIADFGCSYVGYPYVAGGTNLNTGVDCSGFTQAVYREFGITIPRTSYEQRSIGRGVSQSEAQPGDIVCYAGHVGIYIGNGKIVHASTERTGIKLTNANYRTILSIRRVI